MNKIASIKTPDSKAKQARDKFKEMTARKVKQQMPPIKFDSYSFMEDSKPKPIVAGLLRADLFLDECTKDMINQESIR